MLNVTFWFYFWRLTLIHLFSFLLTLYWQDLEHLCSIDEHPCTPPMHWQLGLGKPYKKSYFYHFGGARNKSVTSSEETNQWAEHAEVWLKHKTDWFLHFLTSYYWFRWLGEGLGSSGFFYDFPLVKKWCQSNTRVFLTLYVGGGQSDTKSLI